MWVSVPIADNRVNILLSGPEYLGKGICSNWWVVRLTGGNGSGWELEREGKPTAPGMEVWGKVSMSRVHSLMCFLNSSLCRRAIPIISRLVSITSTTNHLCGVNSSGWPPLNASLVYCLNETFHCIKWTGRVYRGSCFWHQVVNIGLRCPRRDSVFEIQKVVWSVHRCFLLMFVWLMVYLRSACLQ